MKKKAVKASQPSKSLGYIRVSGNEQADEGVSLDAQSVRITAYATMRGLDLVDIIADPGVSAGKPLAEREGGQQLLERLETGTIQHIIALKLDRLFRSVVDCLTTGV